MFGSTSAYIVWWLSDCAARIERSKCGVVCPGRADPLIGQFNVKGHVMSGQCSCLSLHLATTIQCSHNVLTKLSHISLSQTLLTNGLPPVSLEQLTKVGVQTSSSYFLHNFLLTELGSPIKDQVEDDNSDKGSSRTS
jgi:hypothetical protein